MWYLVNFKYADEFVPFWLTEFFHNWPHVSYQGFEKYSSTFNPDDPKYVQTLIFWAAVPVLWLLASLLVLILYGTCQCCRKRRRRAHPVPNQQRKTTCLKCSIIFLVLLCSAIVGGGFYGNETTTTGVQHLIQSAEDADSTMVTAEKEISAIHTGIAVDLAGEVNVLEAIFRLPPSTRNATRQRMLQEETRALQGLLGKAGENVSQISAVYGHSLDLSGAVAEVQHYETIRWLGLIGVFSFELVICLVLLCGAFTRSKCALVSSAILCVTGMVIVWCLAGAEMFVALGISDFCADPNTFLKKEAKLAADVSDVFLDYYMICGQTTNPFGKDLSSANTNLALAGTTLDSIASLAKGFYGNAGPTIAEAKTTLDSVTSSVLKLSGNLDCQSSGLHKDYVTSLYSVCYDSVIGLTVMLLSGVLVGLLFTVTIVATFNFVGRLPKRKLPYAVDQEDPFLPPNDNTATLERYRRNVEPPPRRQDNPPAALPSDPRARPVSLASSIHGYRPQSPKPNEGPNLFNFLQREGYEPGPSGWGAPTSTGAAAAAHASSSNQPPVGRDGFDSPPPSYTLAMSRDRQRRH